MPDGAGMQDMVEELDLRAGPGDVLEAGVIVGVGEMVNGEDVDGVCALRILGDVDAVGDEGAGKVLKYETGGLQCLSSR